MATVNGTNGIKSYSIFDGKAPGEGKNNTIVQLQSPIIAQEVQTTATQDGTTDRLQRTTEGGDRLQRTDGDLILILNTSIEDARENIVFTYKKHASSSSSGKGGIKGKRITQVMAKSSKGSKGKASKSSTKKRQTSPVVSEEEYAHTPSSSVSTQQWISGDAIVSDDNHIPNTYNVADIDAWPKKTSIRCWHCTLNFDTTPLGLPLKYIGDIFYTCGCFCSFSCMSTYNLRSKNNKKWEISSLIYLMRNKMINKGAPSVSGTLPASKKEIPMAPDKEMLNLYGGILTEREYRNIIQETTIEKTEIILPPMVSLSPQCERINMEKLFAEARVTSKNNKVSVLPINFRNIETANGLRVSRVPTAGTSDGKGSTANKTILESMLKKKAKPTQA